MGQLNPSVNGSYSDIQTLPQFPWRLLAQLLDVLENTTRIPGLVVQCAVTEDPYVDHDIVENSRGRVDVRREVQEHPVGSSAGIRRRHTRGITYAVWVGAEPRDAPNVDSAFNSNHGHGPAVHEGTTYEDLITTDVGEVDPSEVWKSETRHAEPWAQS